MFRNAFVLFGLFLAAQSFAADKLILDCTGNDRMIPTIEVKLSEQGALTVKQTYGSAESDTFQRMATPRQVEGGGFGYDFRGGKLNLQRFTAGDTRVLADIALPFLRIERGLTCKLDLN